MKKEERLKQFNELIDLIRFTRMDYELMYQKIDGEYQSKKKRINDTYKPNSPALRDALEEANQERESRINDERGTDIARIVDAISELEKLEKAQLAVFDEAKMDKLNRLNSETLSRRELEILYENFGGKNYWVDRKIAEMTQKAGINDVCFTIEPSIDKKLNILGQLGENTLKYLRDYNGTPEYKTSVLISESVLARATNRYTDGMINSLMSDYQTAQMTFANIQASSNEVEKAIKLQKSLENANANVRNMLIAKASVDPVFTELCLTLAGAKEEVQAFRESGGLEEFKKAERLMNESITMTDNDQLTDMMAKNVNNQMYRTMIESEAKRNETFRKAIHDANHLITVNNDLVKQGDESRVYIKPLKEVEVQTA